MSDSAYARAGVDYTKMEPFKMAMIEAGKKTLLFPNKRGVYINEDATHAHGAVFEYRGSEPHIWCKTQEDLGNKNWIAEWMYEKTGKSYYENIAIDTALIVSMTLSRRARFRSFLPTSLKRSAVPGTRTRNERKTWRADS